MTFKISENWRIWALGFGSLLLFFALGLRLFNLQFLKSDYYEALALEQRQRSSQLTPHRGLIYASEERSGDLFPLAVNKPAWTVYAVPRDMDEPSRVADELAPALYAYQTRRQDRIRDILLKTGQNDEPKAPELNEEEIKNELDILRDQLYQKFNQKTDPYEPLLRPYESLDEEFKRFLDDKQLSGLVLEEKETRFYPEETLAAHVLGFLGWEDDQEIGRYGIEGFFDNELSGKTGFFSAERDTSGQYIGVGSRAHQAAQDGADIVLTIDRVIQSFIEEELADGVQRYDAEGGTIIVTNPQTGAILGMSTYPTFDPNHYAAIQNPRVQVNPAISDLFEPGSIMKPLIMAAAIEEDLIDANTTMRDTGPVKVAEYTIDTFDGQHRGTQTMTQILEQSNNVGMVWVGQKIGRDLMYDYLRRFGLGEKTGVELQGETQTTLPRPSDWDVTTVATTSFGQGIALTPLQAINSINALANQGQLMQPHIVKVITPTKVHRVVSATTADTVTAMMVSVIENGVAQLAKVPGYYLAGKTGTAQVPDERGKYSPDRKIISFVGFGPVDDPQFSILIKLDNPAGLSFASGTAAPMFKRLAEKILTYKQIPPDYDAKQKQPTFTVKAAPDA